MTKVEPKNVLILCTGNSARSILGEALINVRGRNRFKAWSAGSNPAKEPNPFAIKLLNDKGIDTAFARSKSWDEFSGKDAPDLDIVITVCDNAAGESCPIWNGNPIVAHWGIPDPAAVYGSFEEKSEAFDIAFHRLDKRVSRMIELELDQLCTQEIQSELNEIGELDD